MQNADIGFYTIVVVLLFIGFGIGTYAEFRRMNRNSYTGNERGDDQKTAKAFIDKLFG